MKSCPIFHIAALALAISCFEAFAADPGWWTARGVKNGAAASNLSPATIGQAKHMAAMALAELSTKVSPSDCSALQAELEDIGKLSKLPQTQAEFDNQRMVLLSGQLKALAKPFYDRLWALNAAWVDSEMAAANIRVVEPGSSPAAYSPYPWSVAVSDDSNKSPATLGQLKAVFSLRLESFVPLDFDHDGLLDSWERSYFPDLSQTGTGDPDGDGLTNAQELALGFNPSVSDATTDSDGDGLPDVWEIQYFSNLSQNGSGDPDGDGLSNTEEHTIHSNPANGDTDGDGMGDGYEDYYDFPVDSPENIPIQGFQGGPDDDKDGDGETNKEEWEAGSIPTSAEEQPTMFNPPPTMKWFGVSGRLYFIEWSTNLANWNTWSQEFIGTNHEIAVLVETVFGGSPPPSFFYRLKIYSPTVDSDGDGIPDWFEIEKLGTNPNDPASAGGDMDGDGLPDWEEMGWFGSLTAQSGTDDFDNDGYTNLFEALYGLNPTVANASVDPDQDGLSDLSEQSSRCNPQVKDNTKLMLEVIVR